MRGLIEQRGLGGRVEVDSAGTGGWHVGERPDARATAAARERGVRLSGAARQVKALDFDEFDLLLAMDRANERDLRALAPDSETAAKVKLLREFDPDADGLEVPDPYYGGPDGFDRVLDLVQAACLGVLDSLGLDEPAGR
jgi:protein-tyrosine phosphatase